jgi:hypothetical protein
MSKCLSNTLVCLENRPEETTRSIFFLILVKIGIINFLNLGKSHGIDQNGLINFYEIWI